MPSISWSTHRGTPMQVAFILLACLCVAGLGWIFLRPERIFTYPAMICFAFTVFILPQVVALHFEPGGLTEEEIKDATLMGAFCLGAAYAGWCLRPMRWILKIYK